MHGSPPPLRTAPSEGRGHLVTGPTGFIGGALVLELLQHTRDRVYAVVRPGRRGARTRFLEAITHAARVYEIDLDPDALDRCHVLSGDLLQPTCGIDPQDVGGLSHVWHCAASLRYEDRYRDEIRATNVRGTQQVLELAERLGAGTFNYVSTAYVAGRRTGVVREEQIGETETNNHYEQSKIDAERLVSSSSMRVRILRPSVVVGHSRTLGSKGRLDGAFAGVDVEIPAGAGGPVAGGGVRSGFRRTGRPLPRDVARARHLRGAAVTRGWGCGGQ